MPVPSESSSTLTWSTWPRTRTEFFWYLVRSLLMNALSIQTVHPSAMARQNNTSVSCV